MRAVVQRVKYSSVTVNGEIVGKIDKGLLVLLGVTHTDSEKEINWLAKKIKDLRIYLKKCKYMDKLHKEDFYGSIICKTRQKPSC